MKHTTFINRIGLIMIEELGAYEAIVSFSVVHKVLQLKC